MLFKRKTVYVITGMCWEESCFGDKHAYPIMINKCVFKKEKDALAMINEIKEDSIENAAEMNYKINTRWCEDFTTLEIEYPETGTIENWILCERDLF